MRNLLWAILLTAAPFLSGCVETRMYTIPDTPDKKGLYALMEARCEALNKADFSLFKKIYIQDSPELQWIADQGIPMWRENGMSYSVRSFERITIIGDDAAGRFTLAGHNRFGRSFFARVEALFARQGGEWKIESTGER